MSVNESVPAADIPIGTTLDASPKVPISHEWLPKFGSGATRQYGAMPLIGLCPVVSTPRTSCVWVHNGRYPPHSKYHVSSRKPYPLRPTTCCAYIWSINGRTAGVGASLELIYGKLHAGIVFQTSWTVGLLLAVTPHKKLCPPRLT